LEVERLRLDLKEAELELAQAERELESQRARADQLERTMKAMADEFAGLEEVALELARLAGASPAQLAGFRRVATQIGLDPDYAIVGLDRSAPDFLIKAARTAYRKAFHPDTKPPHERATVEAAFKRHEVAFERLFQMRGIGRD
jgi:phage shock protein A